MQRLIEQTADEGDVRQGDAHLGRFHYHLSVYRHFSDREDEVVPAHIEVEGHIRALDESDIVADLHRLGLDLTLQLADGRSLDFVVSDERGNIHSTGRGLR